MTLSWKPGTNRNYVRQYVMRRQQGQAWANVADLAVDIATWTDRSVVLGEEYVYAVRGERANGTGSRSNPVSVRVRPDTSDGDLDGDGNVPPRDLTAEVVADTNEVTPSWTPGTNRDYVRQYVMRRQQNQAWANVADLAVDVATWTDRSVVFGEKYVYAVRGKRANGTGSRSNRVSIRVRPSTAPPYGLAADTSGGSVVLTWTPGINANHVRQVVLRKQKGTKSWTRPATLATDADTWTDGDTMSGVRYFYRVRSEKTNGKGGMTDRVGVVAP